METDMATEPESLPSENLPELIQSLNQALQLAKQIPSAVAGNPDHRRLILSSLHSAQLALSSFLSLHRDSDEVIMAEDGNGEEDQDSSMEKVEEKMRESLCIQNKRRKRTLSPSTGAGEERRKGLEAGEDFRVPADFDPYRTRLRNLELVYQFHG